MKRFAYFQIDEYMSAKSAAEAMARCKAGGFDKVIVLHENGADLRRAYYKDKLMAIFRAAYRSKVEIYLADDSFANSGTGFGEICSVRDVWQRSFEKEEVLMGDAPYGRYADLTDERCAKMAIECVYEPLMREFEKFKGYEFKGFACIDPRYCKIGETAYSDFAMREFEARYKRKPDIKNDGDKEKYNRLLREGMEKNYVAPLYDYCKKADMDFLLVGGQGSVRGEFAKSKGMEFFDGEGWQAKDAAEAISCFARKKDCAVAVLSGMKRLFEVGEFFEQNEGCKVISVEDFGKEEAEEIILFNGKNEAVELGLLPRDGYAIYDWEKDICYDFEKNTYKFYPYSFLKIVKKPDGYTEKVSCCSGRVMIGNFEEEKSLAFSREGDCYRFVLPEDKLGGKCLEIVGKWNYAKVKLGYNEFEFVTEGCALCLYDFLSGGEGAVWVEGGEIESIRIYS